MFKYSFHLFFLVFISFSLQGQSLKGLKNKALKLKENLKNAPPKVPSISEDEAAQALREALNNGINNSVEIWGGVAKPGKYELLSNDYLDDIVKLAGGLLESAYRDSLIITRLINNKREHVIIDSMHLKGSCLVVRLVRVHFHRKSSQKSSKKCCPYEHV